MTMTITDLIEKLKEEAYKQADARKESNGAYGVLKEWYKEMLALDPYKDNKKFDNKFYSIYGFIWGLRAAYYITQEEKDQLLEDLTEINRRFYSISD